jgi:hypothetical protein
LNAGATQTMNAVIAPANCSNKSVTWSSSNPAIATVNSNGTLSAVAPGVCTITATTVDGGKTATSTVTVKPLQNFIELDDATIGTTTNKFKYTGTAWTHGISTSDPYYMKTVSYSNTTNHYATLSFTGNKVEFYSAKASHHGIVAVSVDEGPETMVDLYAASRQNFALAFTSGTLAEGTHSIKIRVTGGRNSSSSGSYAIIDYLKVYSSTAVVATAETTTESLFYEGAENETQIYPNPVKGGDILHVRLVEAAGVVSVIDITGYAHYTTAPTTVDLEIPTGSMPKGMYFVQHKIGSSQVQYKVLVD